MNKDLMNKALNDEDLEKVGGGLKFILNATNISGSEDGKPWEVLDLDCNKIQAFKTRDEAVGFIGNDKIMDISFDQACQVRSY